MIIAKKAYELALKNNETYLNEELEAFYTCIKHEAKNGFYTLEIGFDDSCTLTYSDIVWIGKELYFKGYDIIIYGDERKEKLNKISISWDMTKNTYAEIWYTYSRFKGDECSENLIATYDLCKIKKDCL